MPIVYVIFWEWISGLCLVNPCSEPVKHTNQHYFSAFHKGYKVLETCIKGNIQNVLKHL